jgi:hypothetical protein
LRIFKKGSCDARYCGVEGFFGVLILEKVYVGGKWAKVIYGISRVKQLLGQNYITHY